jgi:hypothetical protein
VPQGDTLTLLGLGFATFFGALRVSPANRFLWILIPLGYVIVAAGCGKAIYDLWESHPVLKLLIGGSAVVLGVIASFLTVEAYRSANVKDYIVLWERNGENWDNGDGKRDVRLCLAGSVIDGQIRPYVLRLAKQQCPARFTPVIQSKYDSLEKGVGMWLTILGEGLSFDNTERGEWRPVLNDASHGQQYWGIVDQTVFHGKSKLGPDGIIKVEFPVGDHKVNYKIEGESRKGCSFSVEGYFLVHIYDKETPLKLSAI